MSRANPLFVWRQEHGLSVAQAAKACQVSRTYWYEYEAGVLPQAKNADRIQAQTGVSRSQLVAWQESAMLSRATGCEVAS